MYAIYEKFSPFRCYKKHEIGTVSTVDKVSTTVDVYKKKRKYWNDNNYMFVETDGKYSWRRYYDFAIAQGGRLPT